MSIHRSLLSGQYYCVVTILGTDMTITIHFRDDPSSTFTTSVLDPISFPTDYCFNHTYVTAGTYDVFVGVWNDRSSANDTRTIDVDSLFACNLTLNHSEYQVTPTMVTLTAPGATRLTITVEYGDGHVLAEAPVDGVDCFDPVVGQKTWERVYASKGIYDIVVNASNTHDSCSVRGVLGVNERIVSLDINTTGHTNLSDTTFFTQTLTRGSNMVCERHYDDEFVTIHYCASPSPESEFSHTYAAIGFYHCRIYCYNYLDYFEFPFDIYVQIPITEFVMNETLFLLTYGGPQDLAFNMINGTNVTVFSSVNSHNATPSYNFGDLVGHVTIYVYSAGFSTLETLAFNEVSRVELTTILQIEKVMSGLLVAWNGQSGDIIYFTPAHSVQFILSTEDGTFPVYTVDYGDGIIAGIQENFGTVENRTEYEIPTAVQYAEGYYTLNFTAANNVSSETALVLIGVEYPVEDFILTYANVTEKTTPVVFHITDNSANTATSTSVLVTYGTITETEDYTPLVDTGTTFQQPHIFQNYGVFVVTVNVSNNVSHLAKDVIVKVGLEVEGSQLNATWCQNTNETVEFTASVQQGSDVTFTFNPNDGFGPDFIQQEPIPHDYSLPWDHIFYYTHPQPGFFLARVNVSSPLNTAYATILMTLENSLNGTNLPQPKPQSLTSGDPAQYIFDAAYVPTSASCEYIYGHDNMTDTEVPMNFTGLQYIHTHDYPAPGTYPLIVNCKNCKTSLHATYDVDADFEISDIDINVPFLVLQTYQSYGFFCYARVGSRIRHSIYYDNITLEESLVLPDSVDTNKFFYEYTRPTNTTVRCRFNNSVTDVSVMQDVIVQHKVDEMTVETPDPDNCVQVGQPSRLKVKHTPAPVSPTDPFLAWSISDGQSGSMYSESLMLSGSENLWLTFPDVGNVTITLNTSNLYNYVITTYTFAVQIEITFFILMTASGILFAAVDEVTWFHANISGSHASLLLDWGDGVTEEAWYLDGPLDGINGNVTHVYGPAQAGTNVTISGTAQNCFTGTAEKSNNLVIEIQHIVNMENMILNYPNPVTTPELDMQFVISIKPGMFEPTAPRCRINYTDLQDTQHYIFPDGPVDFWPWIVNYTFPEEVQLEVELEITCWNDVSTETHRDRLILEQFIEDLDISIPTICETKVPCNFNITMTTGNNLNVTLTISDSTDPHNFLQFEAVTAIELEHVFQNQSRYEITVRAFNHINDSTVVRSLETRHTVKTLQIDNPEFVNLLIDSGELLVKVISVGEVPVGVQISLKEVGRIVRRDVQADWFQVAVWDNSLTTVRVNLTQPRAYEMRLLIINDITQKEKIFTVYGEYPIINLKVDITDKNDNPATKFLRNDLVLVNGSLIDHLPSQQPTNVMYWIELSNYENSSWEASWSHVVSSPGDPWVCNVTARNNVTDISTLVEITVEAIFPLLHLEYKESIVVFRETFINAKLKRQYTEIDVSVCFRMTFSPDDIQYRGEHKDHCIAIYGDAVTDANFKASAIEIIDHTKYWLNMTFTFDTIGLRPNTTVHAEMLRRNLFTNVFEKKENDKTFTEWYDLDVTDIPCSSPVAIPLKGVAGNNVTYQEVHLRAATKTFMLSEYYMVTYECEKTRDTLINWTLYKEIDGEYEVAQIRNCPTCRQIAVGYNIEKNKLTYNSYVLNVSIVMGTVQERYDEFSTWIPIYINVSETPLSCSIKTGEKITLGEAQTVTHFYIAASSNWQVHHIFIFSFAFRLIFVNKCPMNK